MRVLVSGAAGFVGSHLWDALEANGHDVTGFDNLLTGRAENVGGREMATVDIVDRRGLYALANAARPEVVVHCAASYKDPDKWHLDARTNVEGGINAALVARYHGAHLVYFQTILPPVSSYAISKLASEQYQRLSGVPLTVFRLANIYGPRNLSGPVPTFYKRIVAGQRCMIVHTTRDMLFIEDLIRGVVEAIEAQTTGTFDMCSGSQSRIAEIFFAVRQASGHEEPPISFVLPAEDDVQGTISVANALPNWTPTVALPDGIERAVHWYAENGVADTYTHLRLKG